MLTETLPFAKFHEGQAVCFLGGAGIVQSRQFESGSWHYQVQMEMGPEPEMGRVGYETTIWLFEADLIPFAEKFESYLAIA